MDIKYEIKEYNNIIDNIKQLGKELKELKIHKKEQEDKILEYLNETGKENITFNDFNFSKKEVIKRKRRAKADKENVCKDILKQAGITDYEDLTSKLLESLKGEIDKKIVLKNSIKK